MSFIYIYIHIYIYIYFKFAVCNDRYHESSPLHGPVTNIDMREGALYDSGKSLSSLYNEPSPKSVLVHEPHNVFSSRTLRHLPFVPVHGSCVFRVCSR